MNSIRKIGTILGAASLLLGAGCKPDLNVTNPNAPDVARANASPEDVKNLAASAMRTWYNGATDYEPWAFMAVTSDVLTANFGNFGMRFNNLEPRIAYANNSAGGDRGVTESPWNSMYGALGAANDAVRAFKGGLKLKEGQAETDKYRRLGQFAQAASLSILGLTFDRAFIVDDATDPASPPALSSYKDVSANAVAKWAALATEAATKSDTYTATDFPIQGGALTSAKMARIAYTMAALTMAYTPRNAAEAATVNWAQVAAYADKGIGTGSAGAPFDLSVIGDFSNWYSGFAEIGSSYSWMRVDMRVINKLDPSQPAKFNGTIVPRGTSPDARYTSDITTRAPIGDPNRGIYMQSNYYYSRYFDYSLDGCCDEEGPSPYILAAENDLVRAEALIRSGGSLATAATLINNSRVTRGKLAPATAADGAATLLGYIEYERDVELISTNGWDLFRRRHVDGLQAGTARHLPIPAKELETLGLPIYTFGGVGGKVESIGTIGGDAAMRLSPNAASEANLRLPNGESMTLHFPARTTRSSRALRQ